MAKLSLKSCPIRKTGTGKLTITNVLSNAANTGVTVTAGEVAFSCTDAALACELTDTKIGVSVAAGATASGNLRIRRASGTGLQLAGTAKLASPLFAACGTAGSLAPATGGAVEITGTGSFTATQLTLLDVPRAGISLADTATATIDGATITTANTGGLSGQGDRWLFEQSGQSALTLKGVKAQFETAGDLALLDLAGGATSIIEGGSFAGDAGKAIVARSGAATKVSVSATRFTGFDGGAVALAATFTGTVLLGAGTVIEKVGNGSNAIPPRRSHRVDRRPDRRRGRHLRWAGRAARYEDLCLAPAEGWHRRHLGHHEDREHRVPVSLDTSLRWSTRSSQTDRRAWASCCWAMA